MEPSSIAPTEPALPGVVRFDGNASSQNPMATPAVNLPLPTAETNQTAAQVSILSTFASAQAAATNQVAGASTAMAPSFDDSSDATDSTISEDPTTDITRQRFGLRAHSTRSSRPMSRESPRRIADSVSAVLRRHAAGSRFDGPAEIRPPSASASSPAAPAPVAAPIAPGAVDGPEAGQAPFAPARP